MRKLLLLVFIASSLSGALTYQLLMNFSTDNFIAVVVNGVTPPALTATIGVQSVNLRFDGIVAATDHVIGWEVPAPTPLCPLIGIRVTANNQFTADFVVMTAAICTPASGTYKALILRN